MSDELPPLPEFPQSKSYAFGPVEQQWVREYATAYASEAVRAAVERERAGWFRSLASAGDAQAKTEPVAWRQKMMGGEYFYTTASPAMTDWVTNGTYPVEPLYAHPPTQVEPVAWMLVTEAGIRLETRPNEQETAWVPLYAHLPTSESTPGAFARTATAAAGSELTDAPRVDSPTSEWNDAIEAAMTIVLERGRVNNIPGTKRGYLLRQLETTFGLIRALKREPR